MTGTAQQYPKPRLLAGLIGLLGIGLLVPGVQLVVLGGSWYYLIAGLVLVLSSLLLWQGKPMAGRLYAVFLLATVVWSLYESGLDAWALLPRLGFFVALGLLFCLPRVRRGVLQATPLSLIHI